MYKRILVPLDGSVLAERALPHAVEIARCLGSQLWLVRVGRYPGYDYSPTWDGPHYSEQQLEADRKAAADYLEHARARFNCRDLPGLTEVLIGPVAETLLDYALAQGIDLIVMSTHGRSGVSRWVMGSVTDKVVRGAHCPTLIVRGQPSA
ncbi:MAG: universal stress protein [Anaerolineales bacterium]|nr:universal stress protein [Anaerolineales bacterium]